MSTTGSITFKKAANPFYNSGIIGFYRNCKQFLVEHAHDYPEFKLSEIKDNELRLDYSAENLLIPFLEEVYYYMGKKYYDTATEKQKNSPENIYFSFTEDAGLVPHLFPKMNTYGLSNLFTNNAQGVTRLEENSVKFEKIIEQNPAQAKEIEDHFAAQKIKLLKKTYFNEPYTKLTRLELNLRSLQPGDQLCPITGENYKALVEAKNISPFLSGLANFNTHFSSSEKKIGWKALYIIRFAPAVCFYSYQDSYESLICHLFEAGTLESLQYAYEPSLYYQREVLERDNYRINFQLGEFSYPRKDGEAYKLSIGKDVTWPSELTFMLLYRFYILKFKDKITEETLESDLFTDEVLQKTPLSLITFQANKFASTLRPKLYEEYHHLLFIFRMLYLLEDSNAENPVQLKDVWNGLRYASSKTQSIKSNNYNKGAKLERQTRAEIFEAILYRESILHLFEKFYFDLFGALLDGNAPEYRNYRALFNFFKLYQNLIPMNLEKEMQEYAINLGVSIGQGIIRFDNPDGDNVKTNIKIGRKYIIDLRNARTIEQFLGAIERIMFKYQINVKKDLLGNINAYNFLLIKQFAVISALNQINPKLANYSTTEQN